MRAALQIVHPFQELASSCRGTQNEASVIQDVLNVQHTAEATERSLVQ
jgi:hypothetical protein